MAPNALGNANPHTESTRTPFAPKVDSSSQPIERPISSRHASSIHAAFYWQSWYGCVAYRSLARDCLDTPRGVAGDDLPLPVRYRTRACKKQPPSHRHEELSPHSKPIRLCDGRALLSPLWRLSLQSACGNSLAPQARTLVDGKSLGALYASGR